MQHFDNKQTVF